MATHKAIKTTMAMALLLGAVSAGHAENIFYADAINIVAGETRTLTLNLDNEVEFYGFQADINLPAGLTVASGSAGPEITLTSRAANGYSVFYNFIDDSHMRVGTFSTTHSPITGDSGALLNIGLTASGDFNGGTLTVTDIIFIGADDKDVELPDFEMNIGNVHQNSCYIPDFEIQIGETKELEIILDNETQFSAFQTDLYLPAGLDIVPSSFVLTTRAASSHSLSTMSFPDGRTRLACLSLSSANFTGSEGALVTFKVQATDQVPGKGEIQLKNQLFSTVRSKEYTLSNSTTVFTSDQRMAEGLTLDRSSFSLLVGEKETLVATISPDDVPIKTLVWSSSNEEIVTVSATGEVTAVGMGTATVSVATIDGSGLKATCDILVNGTVSITDVYSAGSNQSLKIYDLSGKLMGTDINGLQPGIYIIREGNTIKKITLGK